MNRVLPRDVTSYDLLKTFAVITMIVDHIGYYFFPDVMWWRAIGRMSFPAWFFLVGYANSRDLPPRLIWGAGGLLIANVFAGVPVMPLNVLISIAIIRLCLDQVMDRALRSKLSFFFVCAGLFLLAPLTFIATDYGTLGVMAAMFGYMMRHKERLLAFLGGDDYALKSFKQSFVVFCVVCFSALQYVYFGFDSVQGLFVFIGYFAIFAVLGRFEANTYPSLTARLGSGGAAFLKVCGRHTLEIYVSHLLLFKALAVIWGVEGFSFMAWSWL